MSHDLGETNDMPPLPTRVRSKDGQVIDVSGDTWTIRASADGGVLLYIRWKTIVDSGVKYALSTRALDICRHYLCYRIERKKGKTVANDYALILRIVRWMNNAYAGGVRLPTVMNWSDFDETICRDFLTWGVQHTADKGNDFSRFRTFYKWGVGTRIKDFDPELLRILQATVAPGNLKGHLVRFRHPTKGPFDPEERRLIVDAIQAGQGTERDRALVMLHLELGLNPQATARMRNEDFKVIQSSRGVFYQIDVPRVKKRTAFRETKRRPLSQGLGALLLRLKQGDDASPFFYWLDLDQPEHDIDLALKHFLDDAGIVSPRTHDLLQVSARRFRYTLATDMVEDGASEYHVAEVLDHTDLQNVKVYVETRSTIADAVTAAVDGALQPLVRRFLGHVIESTDAVAVPGQPNQIIPAAVPHLHIPLLSTVGMGVCGRDIRRDGLCRKNPPLGCYSCDMFLALRNGPHHQLLDELTTYLNTHSADVDRRTVQQLEDIRQSIAALVRQIEGTTFDSGLQSTQQ